MGLLTEYYRSQVTTQWKLYRLISNLVRVKTELDLLEVQVPTSSQL